MARGRKSKYVNKLTSKDQNMLRAFRNVGYLNENQLKHKLGMSDRRIQNYCRDGHLERLQIFDKHTKSLVDVYRLTERGQEFARQQMNLNNFYRSVSVSHDLALAHKYLEATQEQQQNWITEKDWKDRFDQEVARLESQGDQELAKELREMWENKLISLTDGGYVEGESLVMVEIITSNYGIAEINAKAEFCKVMNAQYQSYKI